MNNLGYYKTVITVSKKVGGPKQLVAILLTGGYAFGRAAEAGVKKALETRKARNAPCATEGEVFRATSDGNDSGLVVRVGDEYRVLECDGEAILIELLGDADNPYSVSSKFLRSISDFPPDDTERSE